ncbi:hypothetical protein CspeluHIS016_0103780 [Cutaneotrichosporon spelunceum]|uniref:Uncharacterized protein n=1 Tax=Cutaneotrichosporon spelunceum TaxID=1672016 RepID=A0AAD3TNF1_9TREE|nr:hypothetical protein CspeluHIS016_0103780 [Cutaneotrichosporon spelunceum]
MSHLKETLTALNLGRLADTEHVMASQSAVHHFDVPYVVLVGTPRIKAIAHIAAANPQTGIGLIVPLKRGREEEHRAAVSGVFSETAHKIVDASGVVYLGPKVAAAAQFKVVEEAMWGANTMIARETYMLAVKNGVDLNLLYGALANGAAGSQALRDLWPSLLVGGSFKADEQLAIAHQALEAGLELAGNEVFYAPLMGLAKQEAVTPMGKLRPAVEDNAKLEDITPEEPNKVGFVGLGAMGRPMSLGGKVADNVLDCAKGCDVFLLIVVNAAQIEDILFAQAALTALAEDATVLVMATVPSSEIRRLSERIANIRPDVSLVDCPVSGGTPRAATGDLMVFCGGLDQSATKGKAYRVLRLLSSSQGNEHHLVRVPGGVGRGSAVKLSNQHLAGTHISCVAEIQALVAKLGMPGRAAHRLLMGGPGWCWVLGHRGVSMLNGLTQPATSAVTIFVKDMGIVVAEAGVLRERCPLAALVQQQYVFAKSLGWGNDDDSGLVRVWKFADIDVAVVE